VRLLARTFPLSFAGNFDGNIALDRRRNEPSFKSDQVATSHNRSGTPQEVDSSSVLVRGDFLVASTAESAKQLQMLEHRRTDLLTRLAALH
jgi:hypothetical protein